MALFEEKKKGFFGKLSQRIGDAIMGRPELDEDFMDELEEILITSDIGMDTTMKIMEALRKYIKENKLGDLKTIYYYQSDPSNNKLKKPLNIEYIKASGILLALGVISILLNKINKHNKKVINLANPTNNIQM